MLSLEKSSGLALWTLAPAAVVYSCLFCLNPSLLLRGCKLVVRYQNLSSKVTEGFLAKRQMLRSYVWDIVHVLLEGNVSWQHCARARAALYITVGALCFVFLSVRWQQCKVWTVFFSM
uniref:Uncharacterized protein n=1 Tax=Timema genevievae TaxID=629358 RepID=A0A7R9KBK4_TIMGE|nr:unnamed protein product [Timema genevievae]